VFRKRDNTLTLLARRTCGGPFHVAGWSKKAVDLSLPAERGQTRAFLDRIEVRSRALRGFRNQVTYTQRWVFSSTAPTSVTAFGAGLF
jgi:hypothetical protein